ncbi:DUF4430 domain-containing protein [Pseudoneobacillus sp. C159]
MNYFKKTLGLLLTFVLVFSLISCSSTESTKVKTNKMEENTEKTVTEVEPPKTTEIESTIPEENVDIASSEENTADEQLDVNNEDKNQPVATEPTVQERQENTKSQTANTVSKPTNKKVDSQNKSNEKTNTDKPTTTGTTASTKPAKPTETVSISITGSKDYGVILKEMKINVTEEDTVFTILLKAAKKKNIYVDSTGKGAMAYIAGIDNLYEFDYGPKSGWNFKLNGEILSKSSGIVKVKKDDVIEWVYLEDFTENGE